MKFRLIPNTDLVVSEVGLSLDSVGPATDALQAERALRLAYDEGITFFHFAGGPQPFDVGFAAAFSGERRQKVRVALRTAWTGDVVTFSIALAERERSLGIEHVDLLIVDGVDSRTLASGAVSDAVHRLKAAGAVGYAGVRDGGMDLWGETRLLERTGFQVVEADFDERIVGSDERRLPALLRTAAPLPALMADDLSFLWNGTGRTPSQAMVQLALAHPSVCSALPALSVDEIRELARSPLAPVLQPSELSAAAAALRRDFATAEA